MSLTSHLGRSSSPVREFFLERFSDARSVRSSCVQAPRSNVIFVDSPEIDRSVKYLKWDGGPPTVLPREIAGYGWATAGTAFDYRLRFFLGTSDLRTLVAHQGALSFGAYMGASDGLPRAFEQAREVFEVVKGSDENWATLPSPTSNRQLAEISYVLALYEQCFRAVINANWPIVSLGTRATYEDVLSLAHPCLIEDLEGLSLLFEHSQPQFLQSNQAILNPTFGEASVLLGGADADLIVDSRLIDIKTRKTAQLERVDLWQLLGYALADFNDEFRLKEVGFYFSRHGLQVAWDLGVLMTLLSGEEQDLTEVRNEFKQVLVQYNDHGNLVNQSGIEFLLSVLPANMRTSYFPIPERDKQSEVIKNSLLFRPTSSGKGKWHVAYSENPYVYGPKGVVDLSTTPSCGTQRIVIDLVPAGLKLKSGKLRGIYADKCCAKCLEYSGAWHTPVTKYAIPEFRASRRWKFREPVNPRLKWHISRADFYRERRPSTVGVCNSGDAIKPRGKSYPFVDIGNFEVDARFCRHCLLQARQALPLESAQNS
jgi:hypothetical protein